MDSKATRQKRTFPSDFISSPVNYLTVSKAKRDFFGAARRSSILDAIGEIPNHDRRIVAADHIGARQMARVATVVARVVVISTGRKVDPHGVFNGSRWIGAASVDHGAGRRSGNVADAE